MEEKKQFEEILLHDIKNFLTGITTSAGLLLDGYLGNITDEQKEAVDTINYSSIKLQRMLLAYQLIELLESRKYEIKKNSFAVSEMMAKLAWVLGGAKKEKKEVTIDADSKLIVSADEDLVQYVLENLLLNAIKQARESGVALKIEKEGGEIKFTVTVLGQEAPKEIIGSIFEKNFKIDFPKMKALAASGQGFYFCKLAVEALGGKIGAVNENGMKYSFSLKENA